MDLAGGSCLKRRVRTKGGSRLLPIIAMAVAAGAGLPAGAAGARHRFALPGGSLSTALAALARQGRIDVGGSDPALARISVAPIAGALSAEEALARLLEGTPFTFQAIDATTFRIIRRPRVSAPPPPSIVAPRAVMPLGDITVTAGKRPLPLTAYPGSAIVLLPGDDAAGPHGADGQAWMLARTPMLQSTELGSGRNKLFIRGVADSSFAGPTQATVGTYFGDMRTGYNGPDPNLNLYDVDRVEILEGPQGALYGAGSIGGVIRITPRAPALDHAAASAAFGTSVTAHGAPGYDAAAMANLVPLADRVGVRVVGYRSEDGGYINDPGRQARNTNRLTQTGGRIAVRMRPIDGWTIDGGFVVQASRQPDLQYAMADEPPLTRLSAIAQPFRDDYKLARLALRHHWENGMELVASAGRVAHDIDQRYDATRPGQFASPLAYDQVDTMRFTSVEARLSRSSASGASWVAGLSAINASTESERTFGPLGASRDLVGVINRTTERAGYAEITEPILHGVALTAGIRYTWARMDGNPSLDPINGDFIRGRTSSRFDPEAGFTVAAAPKLVWFGQYQQGFRTGGLAVARGIGRVANYDADDMQVVETGLRWLRHGARGVAAVAALSYARWRHIQADLVSRAGFPLTANVGDGRILAFEGTVDWAAGHGLRAVGALFLNRSRLVNPAPDFASSGSRPLPATPSLSATGRIVWSRGFGRAVLRMDAHARYVGHSRLGVGPLLDLPYGDYLIAGTMAALRLGRVEGSITVENALDSRGSRFAIGNPFGLAARDEVTPLRPRTIRLGLSTGF